MRLARQIPSDNLAQDYQGRMDQECPHCTAKYFRNERNSQGKFSICCYGGKVILPDDPYYPDELRILWMGNSEESKEFIRNARTYNNSLALASMNCNFDRELLQGHPYCFKSHGQVYHLTGTLHPPAHRVPNFNQIYIFDTKRARQERNRQAEEYRLNNTILFQLHQLLERINPYVRSFKMMHEVERRKK